MPPVAGGVTRFAPSANEPPAGGTVQNGADGSKEEAKARPSEPSTNPGLRTMLAPSLKSPPSGGTIMVGAFGAEYDGKRSAKNAESNWRMVGSPATSAAFKID